MAKRLLQTVTIRPALTADYALFFYSTRTAIVAANTQKHCAERNLVPGVVDTLLKIVAGFVVPTVWATVSLQLVDIWHQPLLLYWV